MNRTEIKFKGNTISLVFGTWVIGHLIKSGYTLKTLHEEMSINPFEFFPLLVYLGAVNALPSKDPEGYNKNDFYDWVDENGGISGSEMTKVVNCFVNSIGTDVAKKKTVRQSGKVKV